MVRASAKEVNSAIENVEIPHDEFLISDLIVPDDLEETVRRSVYSSLGDMPREMRRAQMISAVMSGLPDGTDRAEVEGWYDRRHG